MPVLIRNPCEHVTIFEKQWVIKTGRHTLSPILTAWPKITQQETLTQDDGGGGGGDQDGDQVLLQGVPLDADQLLLQAGQQGSRPVYKGLHFLLKQCLLQPNLFLCCFAYIMCWLGTHFLTLKMDYTALSLLRSQSGEKWRSVERDTP